MSEHPALNATESREEASPFGAAVGADIVSQRIRESSRDNASVFDPVLAEVAYEWWTLPGDHIIDPFAGGPTRGIVAATLGRRYTGIDLRPEQVEVNYAATERLAGEHKPQWVVGDSSTYRLPPATGDFIFSCPPYGSLEVYSDDPADLSTMNWDGFQDAYVDAIGNAAATLAPDRFAAFVVGNYKENRRLRDLMGATIAAFEYAGLEYYADIVLVTPIGSAAIRASAHFPRNRRPMPRHQYLLLFTKGDPRKAAERIAANTEGLERTE